MTKTVLQYNIFSKKKRKEGRNFSIVATYSFSMLFCFG